MKFLMRTNITKTSMELFPSPKRNFLRHKYPRTFLIYRFNPSRQCKAIHVISNRSDLESLFWSLEQLHGTFSDIGAHKEFQKPEFVMPELLIKELCPCYQERPKPNCIAYTLQSEKENTFFFVLAQ